uniref:Serpentine receptor class gamma n=1 Tax=Caenorhabditis tropicalis TaxID=1561998 RepID=A0A1I7USD5_9PELO
MLTIPHSLDVNRRKTAKRLPKRAVFAASLLIIYCILPIPFSCAFYVYLDASMPFDSFTFRLFPFVFWLLNFQRAFHYSYIKSKVTNKNSFERVQDAYYHSVIAVIIQAATVFTETQFVGWCLYLGVQLNWMILTAFIILFSYYIITTIVSLLVVLLVFKPYLAFVDRTLVEMQIRKHARETAIKNQQTL